MTTQVARQGRGLADLRHESEAKEGPRRAGWRLRRDVPVRAQLRDLLRRGRGLRRRRAAHGPDDEARGRDGAARLPRQVVFSPRGYSADGSRRRRGCDVDIPERTRRRRGRDAALRSRPARASGTRSSAARSRARRGASSSSTTRSAGRETNVTAPSIEVGPTERPVTAQALGLVRVWRVADEETDSLSSLGSAYPPPAKTRKRGRGASGADHVAGGLTVGGDLVVNGYIHGRLVTPEGAADYAEWLPRKAGEEPASPRAATKPGRSARTRTSTGCSGPPNAH